MSSLRVVFITICMSLLSFNISLEAHIPRIIFTITFCPGAFAGAGGCGAKVTDWEEQRR